MITGFPDEFFIYLSIIMRENPNNWTLYVKNNAVGFVDFITLSLINPESVMATPDGKQKAVAFSVKYHILTLGT